MKTSAIAQLQLRHQKLANELGLESVDVTCINETECAFTQELPKHLHLMIQLPSGQDQCLALKRSDTICVYDRQAHKEVEIMASDLDPMIHYILTPLHHHVPILTISS